MFQHILIPTDGSDLSDQAMTNAFSLARTLGARLTAYICLEEYPYTLFSEIVVETPQAFQERIDMQARAVLQSVADAARRAGVACDTDMTRFAMPYLGIIDAAERHGCDLIFMASHGRSGLAGLLLGGTTQKVLSHTKIPTIVYR